MSDPGDREISCSFVMVRPRTGSELIHHDVTVRTGQTGWRMRLRSAAHDVAIVRFYQMWAMPHLVPDSGDWLVYEHNTGAEQSPIFLQRMPTREAAEMWMLHRAR